MVHPIKHENKLMNHPL